MEDGRSLGSWLLTLAWVALLLPSLALAGYILAPPAWRDALGLSQAPAAARPQVVIGTLPPLPETLQAGGQEQGGQPAWRRFRQPAPAVAAATPLIAVVLTGLGRDASLDAAAVALPGAVTLSFSPYGRPFGATMESARSAGHELLLDLPMGSVDALDTGPQALLALLDSELNLRRLAWLLDGATESGPPPPAAGVVTVGDDSFLRAGDLSGPVLAVLATRGLLFLDAVSRGQAPPTASLAAVLADRQLTGDAEAFAHQLAELERVALLQGSAVGVAAADPLALARLQSWLASLERRGYALAPLSAVYERRGAGR